MYNNLTESFILGDIMSTYHYSRVSLDDQHIENQQEYVKSSGFVIDDDCWFSDTGVSGGTVAIERPAFSALFSKIKKGDILVINAVDRLGRDTIDFLTTIKMLEKMVCLVPIRPMRFPGYCSHTC